MDDDDAGRLDKATRRLRRSDRPPEPPGWDQHRRPARVGQGEEEERLEPDAERQAEREAGHARHVGTKVDVVLHDVALASPLAEHGEKANAASSGAVGGASANRGRIPRARKRGRDMSQQSNSSRRLLLQRALAVGVTVPLLGPLVSMLRRVRSQDVPRSVAIPADVPAGLSIVDFAVVFRGADGAVRAYSARCTHFGCRIDRVVGDEAVCPCHGSRFRADGSAAVGPASRPLTRLRIAADPASGGWTAHAS